MTNESQEQDMIFGLTADERDALHHGLRNLPETMPPRVVWERIREQAHAEGLLKTQGTSKWQWSLGAGVAAAAVLAVVLLLPVEHTSGPEMLVSQTVPDSLPTNEHSVTALQALMVESRQLEANLRELPAKPRVTRAGTAATISEIQDRVAAIDYQLGRGDASLTPEQEEALWQDRVRLMKTLVGLRYAQAQRMAL
jgi:hypothetical protein